MANIERMLAGYKNRIASAIGEGGQIDLGNDGKLTWNWCNDKRYPAPRYKYFSYQNADNSIHRSGIYDTETGQIVA